MNLPPALWILAVGTFTVGTDAYVIAGVLPDLSRDLHVSASAAGQLITVFAAVYALFAPVGAMLSGRWSQRTVLVGALAVLTAGNLLTAMADGYPAVLAGRAISAVGAASFTPQAGAAATSLVAPALRARALAVVVSGLTAATVLGVPLGTMVAGSLGWRATMLTVAVLGGAAMAGTVALLSSLSPPERRSSARLSAAFKERTVLVVLAVSLLTATAEQVVYAYVGPVLGGATHGNADTLSGLLLVFGTGAIVGNGIAGVATQRIGSRATLILAVSGMTLDLALLPCWSGELLWALGAMFLWGLTGWMYVVPQQHRLLTFSRTAGPLAVALNNSVFYLGIAAGGGIGGVVLQWSNPHWLAVPAVLLGTLAVATAAMTYRPQPSPEPERAAC